MRLNAPNRRCFIGGSDARIIMGNDETALIRLWPEKRGEVGPEDLSGNLLVQLGKVTEDLNRSWYERNTGRTVGDVQRLVKHSAIPWMAATLDGIVEGIGAVFEANFMLPWSFSEEAAAEKYMAQVQHNMWVTHLKCAVLSIITGGGKWVEITVPMDPLYLSILVSAEKKFWRCVQSGEPPHLINAEPPRPRIEAIRIVDMSSSNSWAEFAAVFRNTRGAFLDHERAKTELKTLMPEDAKEAIGHGVRAKRSKSGAVSFDILDTEAASESFAALAAALAKAQAHLVNPEKSLTAAIRPLRPGETARSFRYAPLSSGLESVRKTLSEHEIAVIQTTAIDQASRMLNLTTLLAHSSGEWIASHWPVCPMAEVANPHRMGAALTYARRYALFTLVGIAGEDDLDAPDICMPAPSTGSSSAGLPFPSQTQGNGKVLGAVKTPSPMVLPVDESAALRDRLLSEIAGLASQDSATTWAREALPAKNSLTCTDAKMLEDAFEQKLTGFLLAESATPVASGDPASQEVGASSKTH